MSWTVLFVLCPTDLELLIALSYDICYRFLVPLGMNEIFYASLFNPALHHPFVWSRARDFLWLHTSMILLSSGSS